MPFGAFRKVVDDHRFPLVTTSLPAVITHDVVDELEQGLRAALARRAPFAHLGDARAVSRLPDLAVRRRLATLTSDLASKSVEHVVGSALVLPKGALRSALTGLGWLHPPVVPWLYCAEPQQGFEFCARQLEKARVTLPHAMREYGHSLVRDRVA